MNKNDWITLVSSRLDTLEKMLCEQEHLTNPEAVTTAIANISKFYSSLSSDDREFIQAASQALKDKMKWQIH